MGRLALCVTFLVVLAYVHGRHEQYEGHRLYRLSGPAVEISSLDEKLDLWGTSRGPAGLEAGVRLAPEEEQRWLSEFAAMGIEAKLISDNVAELFRKEDDELRSSREAAKRTGRTITWDTYYRHSEINAYLDSIAEQYPNLVTLVNAGNSTEGRLIKYLRISTSNFENLSKPVIVIDAAVHAREWVTTPVALYLIHQLVVEQADRALIEQLDWVIIPLANPDGYEYTFTDNRLWRKTRSTSHPNFDAGPNCIGVDGNRNFAHHWGTSNATADPCTIVYEGPSAFSEPEIRVIRNVVLQHLERVYMYISLHSYGNMFLYAWGNNGTAPENGPQLHEAGVTMADVIDALAINGTQQYIVGNAAQVLYYSTGTSRDWTRSVGVPLTYTLELPGYTYFFQVPPTYVRQIVTETYAGIAAGARFVLESTGSGASSNLVHEWSFVWSIVLAVYCLYFAM